MGSPVLWGPNNYANNLQNAELTATGALLAYNGPKNYITYGNFENQLTTGWSLGTIGTLTNGLPTGSPTFGSGASGNLSVAIVTSNQLAGTASLSYVSSAATTAGNMLASQAYTIDVEDQAKVLGFKFSYSAISNASNANWSGTSSNSFGVAVYDVTNSVFLGVAGAFNIVQSSGTGIATGTFQTGTTTASIRFIVYNVNATSGAITLYFDSFQVGPQVTMQAPAMSDWISFTPTGAWTANVTYVGKYRRVGDSYEFDYSITCSGAPTSATLILNLPSGITIDTTKLALSGNDNEQLGFGVATDTGVNSYPCVVNYGSTTTVKLLAQNAAGTYALESAVTQAVPFTFGNTDTIQARFSAPISGLSSNSVSSSDTDTRVIAMQANRITSSQTITTSVSQVQFNNTVQDTAGGYSLSTFNYTIPVTGIYTISGNLMFTSAVSLTSVLPYIYVNGSPVWNGQQIASATVNGNAPFTYDVQLSAGATVGIWAQTSGASSTLLSNSSAYFGSYVNISRKSGPAVVTATESVNALYTTAAAQSVANNSATQIVFGTKVIDSHNVMNSGTYTVPISGKYAVQMALYSGSTAAALTDFQLIIYKNGSAYQGANFPKGGTSTTPGAGNVSTLVSCNAGDTLAGYWLQTSGGSLALLANATFNWISIERVGN